MTLLEMKTRNAHTLNIFLNVIISERSITSQLSVKIMSFIVASDGPIKKLVNSAQLLNTNTFGINTFVLAPLMSNYSQAIGLIIINTMSFSR